MFYEVYNDELFFLYKLVRVFERRVEYVVFRVVGIKFKKGFDLGMKRKIIDDFYLVMIIFFKELIYCLIWLDLMVWFDFVLGVLFDILLVI